MMKTIVVSGGASNVGKTSLVNEIALLLNGFCRCVKIGHSEEKPDKSPYFYPAALQFKNLIEEHAGFPFLIIESNSILSQMTPDLLIYLDSEERKPSAEIARRMAHLKSGCAVSADIIEGCAERTGLSPALIRKIAWMAGARPEGVQGALLAGGKSSRMGTDKATLPLWGTTMAQSILQKLSPHCDNLVISIAQGENSPVDNVPAVLDGKNGMGPLMGIYSVLAKSLHRICIIVACDIPEIHPLLLRKMLSFADDFDIVIPSFSKGKAEPLIGIYTTNCLSVIKKRLNSDQLKVSDLFSHCKTMILSGFDGTWYKNLNTPQEYIHYCKAAGIPHDKQ